MTYKEASANNTKIMSDPPIIGDAPRKLLDGVYERWVKLPSGLIGFVRRIQVDTGNIFVHVPFPTKAINTYRYGVKIVKSEDWSKCELICDTLQYYNMERKPVQEVVKC
jgi:hypothetical protein